ncbi:MAG: hypothetical protein PGN07_06320 [Aeromicrobium erythreum]
MTKSSRRRRPPTPAQLARKEARKQAGLQAAKLEPLRPVKVTSRKSSDGAPLLEDGQVYATRGGTVFHPGWCGTVGDLWDRHPTSLLVVLRSEVGSRRECQNCALYPLTGNF